MIDPFGCRARIRSVNPTGTVDLMTMVAAGLTTSASAMVDSTEQVLKKFATGS